MLRAGKHPLVQVAKRLTERTAVMDFNLAMTNEKPIAITNQKGGKIVIQLPNYILSTKFKDMWFFAKGKIYKMMNALLQENQYIIEALELKSFENFFEAPFRSTFLNIHLAKNPEDFSSDLKFINIADIKCKFVIIKITNESEYLFIPLIHTLRNV